eukprot:scaffold28_cov155-Amphora_coffeaeformis.AAC.5
MDVSIDSPAWWYIFVFRIGDTSWYGRIWYNDGRFAFAKRFEDILTLYQVQPSWNTAINTRSRQMKL